MSSNNPNNQPQNISSQSQPIDLNNKARKVDLQLTDEAEYTIKSPKSKLEEWNKVIREGLITLASILAIGSMCYFCFQTIQSTKSSADDKKWAQSALSLIVGAGVGYISAKNQKDA